MLTPHASDSLAPVRVSIILPTYNRSAFLPEAFQSIESQTFREWELIVVDDGSQDSTRTVVDAFASGKPHVRYIHQSNQGPYGARNTGLDHAVGEYIAFFDSDDLWLPHHLAHSVEALDATPDVDWVYGACRMVDHATGRVLAPSTFYVNGRARPFLGLQHRRSGRLHVIDDPGATACMIRTGHYCGLQNSVFRRTVLGARRFSTRRGHEGEDRLVIIRALVEGHRFGYFDDVHVIYRIHPENSSAPGGSATYEKKLTILTELVRGREELRDQLEMSDRDRRALEWRIEQDLFWGIGYSLHWKNGRFDEALACYRRALARFPWDMRAWKTYALAALRVRLRLGGAGS